MRISEEYLRRLLWETDATEAVHALSQFWWTHARAHEPCLGLSRTEYAAELVLIYLGEVGNGGHLQYFENRGLSLCADTIRSLNVVGLVGVGRILESAVAALPADGRDVMPEVLPRGTLGHWEKLDGQLYESYTNTDATLLEYLRSNESELMRAERKMHKEWLCYTLTEPPNKALQPKLLSGPAARD